MAEVGEDIRTRLALVGGVVVFVAALFAPDLLVPVALAYPVGLAFVAVTGGSLDGRRTRRGLAAALLVIAVATVAMKLEAAFSMWVAVPWAAAGGVAGAWMFRWALAPVSPRGRSDSSPSSPGPDGPAA